MNSMNFFPDIKDLLLNLGYHEACIGEIINELEDLFEAIGFDGLKKKASEAVDAKDTAGLIGTLKDMMKLMENRGIYRPDFPAKLIKLLVNGLNLRNEDIFELLEDSGLTTGEIRKEQEFQASCAAITQLGYILLSGFIRDSKAASSGEHVFILVDGFTQDSIIFVDFSIDSILETDARQFETDENNYRLMAPASDDETSKHIAQYYSYFHATSGIGLSHNIHNNLGIAYDRIGMNEEALAEFNEALRLDRGYVEVFNNIAVTYHRMGMQDEAIKNLREALVLRPGYPEAHCNLGNVYSSSGRYDDALVEFKIALSIDPGSALVHNDIGNLYAEQEKIPEAILEFQESVRLDPSYLPPRINLGTLYARQGRHNEALREFQEALKVDPELPEAYQGIGRVYYELGNPERSANAWIRAVYFAPELLEQVPDKLLLKVRQGISRLRRM